VGADDLARPRVHLGREGGIPAGGRPGVIAARLAVDGDAAWDGSRFGGTRRHGDLQVSLVLRGGASCPAAMRPRRGTSPRPTEAGLTSSDHHPYSGATSQKILMAPSGFWSFAKSSP
jgi:hypothetical protein